MPSRPLQWTLAILAFSPPPLLSMAGTMACCGCGRGRAWWGMSAVGLIWMLLAAAVVVFSAHWGSEPGLRM